MSIPPKTLLIQSLWKWYIFDLFSPGFPGNITFYDFDTKLPKRPTSITGLSGLDEYGGNLALVLRNILDNPEARHQFTGLVKDINYLLSVMLVFNV